MARFGSTGLQWRRRLHKLLVRHLYNDDGDYGLARAIEPLITNKVIIYYILPIPVIEAFVAFLAHASVFTLFWLLGGWYVLGFAVFVGLAMRWLLVSREVAARNELLINSRSRFARTLVDYHNSNPDYFCITEWHEHFDVTSVESPVKIVRTVTLRPGRGGMNFYWTGINSHPTADAIDQEQVVVSVHLIKELGDIVLDHDAVWNPRENDHNRSEIYVYLERAYRENEEITIRVTWTWPGMLDAFLNRHHAEPFNYTFRHTCNQFTFSLIAPPNFSFDWDVIDPCSKIEHQAHKRKRIEVQADEFQKENVFRGRVIPLSKANGKKR